jgi:esterase
MMKKIETSFNTEIAYIREGRGFPVILIHGLDSNMASLYSLKDELKGKYDVIVYDVRGHGKSSKPTSFHLDDHVEDLKCLMDKLEINSAHLIGHDMGGVIAKQFTNKYECKVRSLTLIASNLIQSVHGLNKLMVEHQDEIEGFDKSEALIILFPYLYKKQEKAKKWFQNQLIYSRQSPEASAIATRALLNFPVLNEEIIIQKVNVPTLIVNGIYDPLVEMENFEQYRGAFKSLKTFKFEQSGHAPHIEEPNHFLNVYLNFVGSLEFQK